MYFSRAVLREDVDAAVLARFAPHDGYGVHQLVWRLFAASPEQKRDFLFREESVSRRPTFYLVSARPPDDRDGLWTLQSKPYTPRLQAGERLSFRLRANAVRSRPGAESGSVRRHDVVMDLKTRLKAAAPDEPLPPLPALVQEAGFRWLVERAAKHGFHIDEGALRVDAYRQHWLVKRRRQPPIRFSTLDFEGILTVTEPGLLVQALYEGIGPAKGFGCGLLMVKRV